MSGEVDRVIYQFWTGDNPITENRLRGVEDLKANAGVPVVFLDKKGIEERILPDVPLHPAYRYLCAIHKADYLRCYFMHHFGGGYADVKHYSKDNNWAACFDLINGHPEVDIVGEKEIKGGAAFPAWNKSPYLEQLIINGYFIVRPKSEFSTAWWNRVNDKLDEKYEALKARPAVCPRDHSPEYPLRWTEILGEIVHELCIKYFDTGKISNVLKSGRMFMEYQ